MYITYLLLVVTIGISVKAFSDDDFRWKWMWNPYQVVHHQQWYRSFSHAFIHANWMHLIFNMFVLYSFAIQATPKNNLRPLSLEPELVAKYGAKGYLYFGCLYVGGILFSNIISLRKHKDNIHYNALGASGAVMAVLFAYMLLNPTASLGLIILPGIRIPAYIFAPIILIIEYVMSKRGGTGIAHEAHFGGAVFGLVFMAIVDYQLLLEFVDKIVG